MSGQKAAQVAELFTKVIATTKCFDQNLRKVKVIACSNGRLLTGFQVGAEHLNQRGTLHGGFIAHLVDAVSTYALTANDNVETRGVSIDLSVSYFTAAKEGDEIEVEAITKKLGKKIAFLEVEVRNKATNKVLASGRHTKYIVETMGPRSADMKSPSGWSAFLETVELARILSQRISLAVQTGNDAVMGSMPQVVLPEEFFI